MANQSQLRPNGQAIKGAPTSGYASAVQEYTRTRITHSVGVKAGMTREEMIKALHRVPEYLKVASLAYQSGPLSMIADSTVVFIHFVEDIDTPTGQEQASANGDNTVNQETEEGEN